MIKKLKESISAKRKMDILQAENEQMKSELYDLRTAVIEIAKYEDTTEETAEGAE